MKFCPHEYQTEAIEFLLQKGNAALFADPGSGKTAIMLEVLSRLGKSALVIAPIRVSESVWPDEIQKWGYKIKHCFLHGPKKKASVINGITLINPEGLEWYFKNIDLLPEVLIIDESSKFKSWSSKRVKLLKKHLRSFQNRYIMTGTPTPHSLLDLFSQMYIVDAGESLGSAITRYRSAYFEPYGYENRQWRIRKGMDEIIYSKIAPITMRIDSSTFLNLPDCIVNDISITLDKSSRKFYNCVEQDFFATWKGEPLRVTSSGSKYLVCRQVASGQAYKKAGSSEVINIHRLKFDALSDLVDELQGKPVLIAYNFRHELAELKKMFPSAPVIGGGEACDINRVVSDWNKGKLNSLIANPKSMAHGLNLQGGGHDIVWFSLTDNHDDYVQFNKRIHRQGVKETVRIHRLIVKNTVETAIARSLDSKTAGQQALLDAITDLRNTRQLQQPHLPE